MGLNELIIAVPLIMWLFGYFGRGRWYGTGPAVTTGAATGWWAVRRWVHTLIVLALILLVLPLRGLI